MHPNDSVRQLFAKHMGRDTAKLLGGRAIQLTAPAASSPKACEACHLGKSHRAILPKKSTSRSTAPLELVHMDICGPFRVTSVGGARYWLLIVDDHCRYVYLRTMKDKTEAPSIFKAFKAYAELHFKEQGHVIKQLRVDGAGELNSDEFMAYLTAQGITHQLTSAYTSEQNGVVERKHRVIAERMRAMMLAWGPPHDVPAALWAEVAHTSAYLLNRCITSALPGTTPYEAWHGIKPSYIHLRTLGCLAYAHSHPVTRNKKGGLGKLGPQATRCAMLGYSENAKAYRLWDFQAKKVIVTIHAAFEERQPAFTATTAAAVNVVPLAAWEDILPPLLATHLSSFDSDTAPSPIAPPASTAGPPSAPAMVQPSAPPASAAAPTRVQPTFLQQLFADVRAEEKRDTTLPVTPSALHTTSRAAVTSDDPLTYNEAMSRPDAPLWVEAMEAEMKSQIAAHTFDIVDLPQGRHAIGGKWVYRTKRGPNGEIVKYKARWVAQGFAQKYGIDYNETFAPVARFDSIRALLALVAHHDWELHQMDVKSAYLNGDLEEELYMKQPTGFVAPGTEGMVCRLNKSLYGLKQAGRTWNKRIDVELKAHGFAPIDADPCVYAYKRGSVVLIISLYVDDLLLASDSLQELNKVKVELQACFDMEDMGEASYALGIKIARDRAARTLTISQGAYILDVLTRFDMQDCRPVSTPMP